jgi:two-component sensor histidine kinase
LQTPEGSFVLSSVVDITERKRADDEREDLMGQLRTLNVDLERRVTERTAQLSATLREREVLLQEIHHRVKNNLQVISSLINMQVRQLVDPSSRDALEECQTRVQAIALIHEKLYQSKDYSRVPFSEYAKSLASNIFTTTGISPTAVSLQLAMDDVSLGVDKAIPCGLILNELITNALKHAFPPSARGTVRVELHADGDRRVTFAVGDDGVGMPQDFDLKDSSSLGLSLVYTLVEQLEGEIEILRDSGTKFCVTFPMGTER